MEKLTPLIDPETSTIWETFRVTPLKDLIQEVNGRAEELHALSPELLSALEKAALEAAFVQCSLNFLFLYLVILQQTNQAQANFPKQVKAAGWETAALVQQLSAHVGVLNITETPAPVDTFQLRETDLPLFTFKLDKLRGVSFPDLAEKFTFGMLPFAAFRSLDVDAYLRSVAQRDDLAVILLLLTVFSTDELLSLAIKHPVGQLAFTVALLWRAVNLSSKDGEVNGDSAISALLTQLQRDHPAVYCPVIAYFKDQPPFTEGFAHHLSSLDSLSELRLALAPLSISSDASPKSFPAMVTTAFYAFNPENKDLFLNAVFDFWQDWYQQQINDPNIHLHHLPVSSFQAALSDYFTTTLTPDAALKAAAALLAVLRSIDLPYFKSKSHQDKTVQVHFAHLQYVAAALPALLPPNNPCQPLANALLTDLVWMTRHILLQANWQVLEKLLRRFVAKLTDSYNLP